MSNGFDPVAFAAGIGAGQEAANRANSAAQNAEHAAELARIQADASKNIAAGAQDTALALAVAVKKGQTEISQKWIPYGVRMNASIFAGRARTNDLIAALKASDPTNADRIIADAEKHLHEEYARLTKPGSEELRKIHEETLREAEEGRLDR